MVREHTTILWDRVKGACHDPQALLRPWSPSAAQQVSPSTLLSSRCAHRDGASMRQSWTGASKLPQGHRCHLQHKAPVANEANVPSSASVALASLLFGPLEPQNIAKIPCVATFLLFARWSSFYFHSPSLSLFSDSSHTCCCISPQVRSLTSKLPSIITHDNATYFKLIHYNPS